MHSAFSVFDKDGSGTIAIEELRTLLKSLGQSATEEELRLMMAEADADASGQASLAVRRWLGRHSLQHGRTARLSVEDAAEGCAATQAECTRRLQARQGGYAAGRRGRAGQPRAAAYLHVGRPRRGTPCCRLCRPGASAAEAGGHAGQRGGRAEPCLAQPGKPDPTAQRPGRHCTCIGTCPPRKSWQATPRSGPGQPQAVLASVHNHSAHLLCRSTSTSS
jgi:hypothetical protein